ncbi:Protein CBG00003 [Caenorhabditis briggsae]|uniref:Protein CBG00003 n=1 Tax=Caenorhabditis briggsae TaxID=6238 RepID=A8WM44_CAEBR|nr:Protein CBG00003 [Caenorhabditis briggsae]CAP21548.2 Protein CBG00003 [Caenorhabditis briggsae]
MATAQNENSQINLKKSKDHPMKLSIGGKKFEVSKTTIEKCFSRLKRDFELSSETPMSSGSSPFFYERDPKHFQLILNFMRDGNVILPQNSIELKEILEEAKFYILQELKSARNPIWNCEFECWWYRIPNYKSNVDQIRWNVQDHVGHGITVKINEIDTLFIDRSPKHFDLILNFMRDGDVEFPENSREIREIRREAQYYLLGGLVEACEQFFVAF